MMLIDKLKNPLALRLLIGLVLVSYLASVGYEWYIEGFLPFGPQR